MHALAVVGAARVLIRRGFGLEPQQPAGMPAVRTVDQRLMAAGAELPVDQFGVRFGTGDQHRQRGLALRIGIGHVDRCQQRAFGQRWIVQRRLAGGVHESLKRIEPRRQLWRLAIAAGMGDHHLWRCVQHAAQSGQAQGLPLLPGRQAQFAAHALVEEGFALRAARQLCAGGRGEDQAIGLQARCLLQRVQRHLRLREVRGPERRLFEPAVEQRAELRPAQADRRSFDGRIQRIEHGEHLAAGIVVGKRGGKTEPLQAFAQAGGPVAPRPAGFGQRQVGSGLVQTLERRRVAAIDQPLQRGKAGDRRRVIAAGAQQRTFQQPGQRGLRARVGIIVVDPEEAALQQVEQRPEVEAGGQTFEPAGECGGGATGRQRPADPVFQRQPGALQQGADAPRQPPIRADDGNPARAGQNRFADRQIDDPRFVLGMRGGNDAQAAGSVGRDRCRTVAGRTRVIGKGFVEQYLTRARQCHRGSRRPLHHGREQRSCCGTIAADNAALGPELQPALFDFRP